MGQDVCWGWGQGVGQKLLSLRSPECRLEFQNGKKDLSCFHMEIDVEADFVSGWN